MNFPELKTATHVSSADDLPVNSGTHHGRIYFHELDGLRFLAFLLVFFNHQEELHRVPYLWTLQAKGWIGVNLFFTLSAYLFTILLRTEYKRTGTIQFKKFYLRRIFRIWPLYFVYVGAMLGLHFLFVNDAFEGVYPIRMLGLFTFTDNIMAAVYGGNPLPLTHHLWTISYEEQFYVLVPFIILWLVRSSRKARWITGIAAFVLLSLIRLVFVVEEVSHPALWVLPVTNYESILLGIVLGFGGMNFLQKWIRPGFVAWAALAFLVSLYFQPRLNITTYWLFVSYACVGLSTALLLFAVTKSHWLKALFSQKLWVYLGKRSYGLYVYHFLGNSMAAYISNKFQLFPGSLLFAFVCSLLLTILMAVLSYRLLEVPFLNLKKKYEVVSSRPV